jgi:hypothetical protein
MKIENSEEAKKKLDFISRKKFGKTATFSFNKQ